MATSKAFAKTGKCPLCSKIGGTANVGHGGRAASPVDRCQMYASATMAAEADVNLAPDTALRHNVNCRP